MINVILIKLKQIQFPKLKFIVKKIKFIILNYSNVNIVKIII